MKKAILEYDGQKVMVDVPEHIEIISELSDYIAEHIPLDEQFDHQDELGQSNEEFIVSVAYAYISEYYDKVGKEKFNNNEIWFAGFLNKDYTNGEIIDYCVFEKETPWPPPSGESGTEEN